MIDYDDLIGGGYYVKDSDDDNVKFNATYVIDHGMPATVYKRVKKTDGTVTYNGVKTSHYYGAAVLSN